MTNIDAEDMIAKNTDPFGKKWDINPIPGLGMFHIGTVEDDKFRPVVVAPKEGDVLLGMFTKRGLAEEAIRVYLNHIWKWSASQEKLKKAGDKRFKANKEE